MSAAQPLELERPRDLGDLLGTALRAYQRNVGTLFAIGLAISLTVNGIVLGVGLEQIWSGYDDSPSSGETVVLMTTGLLTNPLIIAMTAFVLTDLADGQQARAGSAIQRGLDVFPALLVAVVLATAGVALGFIALVVPGVYFAIRWYLVVQTVALEGVRGTDALRRSADLVRGSWWRVFGVVVVAALLTTLPGLPITIALAALAESADSAAISLAGQIVFEALLAPLNALIITLLYFDLRARARAAPAPSAVSGPPDPPGLPPRS